MPFCRWIRCLCCELSHTISPRIEIPPTSSLTTCQTKDERTFSRYCATAQHPYFIFITRPFSAPALAPPALNPPPPPFAPSALFTIFSRSSVLGYPPLEGSYDSQKVVNAWFPPRRSLESWSGVHLSIVTERTKLWPFNGVSTVRRQEYETYEMCTPKPRIPRISTRLTSNLIIPNSLRWIPEHSKQINVPC